MANTFDELVNLAPVDDETTYLVNDLPGLSQEMVESLTRVGDSEAVEDLWGRVKSNALESLTIDFEVMLSEKRDFHHEMATTKTPLPEPDEPFMTYESYQGAVLEMRYHQHVAIKPKQLIVWAESSGTAQVVVYDRNTLRELWRNNNQALVAGINRISIALTQTTVDLGGALWFFGLKTAVRLRPMYSNMGFTGAVCSVAAVYSSSTNDDLVEQTKALGGTSPVHLDCKIVGDMAGMVEEHKEKLAPAFRYLCGHLLLKERLTSDNFNVFTNTNQLSMGELRDDYHTQYKSHLTKAIKTIYTNIENSAVIGTNPEHQGGYFIGSYV